MRVEDQGRDHMGTTPGHLFHGAKRLSGPRQRPRGPRSPPAQRCESLLRMKICRDHFRGMRTRSVTLKFLMPRLPDQRSTVSLAGAINFRDLGGYHTSDGRRTRFGRALRSNSLQELTEADLEIIRKELGLVTVLDLRSGREIAHDGVGP